MVSNRRAINLSDYSSSVGVRMSSADLPGAIVGTQEVYQNIFPGNPFAYFFLDDHFNEQYQADQRFGKTFGFFAVLTILVACLGLFGLSSFMASQRTKEIGIRKVLGASVSGQPDCPAHRLRSDELLAGRLRFPDHHRLVVAGGSHRCGTADCLVYHQLPDRTGSTSRSC